MKIQLLERLLDVGHDSNEFSACFNDLSAMIKECRNWPGEDLKTWEGGVDSMLVETSRRQSRLDAEVGVIIHPTWSIDYIHNFHIWYRANIVIVGNAGR